MQGSASHTGIPQLLHAPRDRTYRERAEGHTDKAKASSARARARPVDAQGPLGQARKHSVGMGRITLEDSSSQDQELTADRMRFHVQPMATAIAIQVSLVRLLVGSGPKL